MNRSNKKGDLALSSNAIVVLIIAITVLGLALAFTRNIFDTLGGEARRLAGQTTLKNPPTIEDPMTLSKMRIEIRRGDKTEIQVGFFNKYAERRSAKFVVDGCTLNEEDTKSNFTFTVNPPKVVDVNKIGEFSISLTAKKNALAGEHVCSFRVIADVDGNFIDTVDDQDYLYQDPFITVN